MDQTTILTKFVQDSKIDQNSFLTVFAQNSKFYQTTNRFAGDGRQTTFNQVCSEMRKVNALQVLFKNRLANIGKFFMVSLLNNFAEDGK